MERGGERGDVDIGAGVLLTGLGAVGGRRRGPGSVRYGVPPGQGGRIGRGLQRALHLVDAAEVDHHASHSEDHNEEQGHDRRGHPALVMPEAAEESREGCDRPLHSVISVVEAVRVQLAARLTPMTTRSQGYVAVTFEGWPWPLVTEVAQAASTLHEAPLTV